MKYLKKYKIFESSVYGQIGGFENQIVLNTIRNIILELEDNNIDCRLWINGHRSKIIIDKLIRSIEIEINHESEKLDLVNDVISRIEKYLVNIGKISKTIQGTNNKYTVIFLEFI
jgi:hypothetical protein